MNHEIQQVLVTVPDIRADKLIFEGVDMTKGPFFSTGVVSKVFFARTPYWLRWREREDDTSLDGVAVQPKRSASHIRQFSLADIENIAHALHSNGVLPLDGLVNTLRALHAVGVIHNLVV